MTNLADQLNIAVHIKPDDPNRTVRLAGPVVDGWSDDAKAIWQVPYDADNKRLQDELILLAEHIKEGRGDALRTYLLGAQRYWNSDNIRYEINRQKLADALQPWRDIVFNALLDQDLTDQKIANLAELAPSIEVKAEREGMLPLAFLPVGAIGPVRSDGPWGLLSGALLLPAFLAPITYIPWNSDAAQHQLPQPERAQSADASRHSLLLRSEDTYFWKIIETGLISSGSLIGIAPEMGLADKPERLASCLVMPEPINGENGGTATPSEIYLYAHGMPGKGFSESLHVHFEFTTRQKRLGFKTKASSSWDLENHHISNAIEYAKSQHDSGARPFIIFSVCYSAGEVGEE